MNKINCRICGSPSLEFYRDPRTLKAYHHCGECDLRFLNPVHYLGHAEEEARYRLHENCVEDEGYQKFNRPVIDLIRRRPPPLDILDFGCGNGPVIPHIFQNSGHNIALYDPFFRPDESVLEKKYDVVTLVEVAEHLYYPQKEFTRIKKMLKPGGRLIAMTELFRDHMNFGDWYYRKDPTHVCLYSERTMSWLKDHLGFASVRIELPRLILFTN
jgi:SAM-dependent methyltransferase